jgi:hypothetical protein
VYIIPCLKTEAAVFLGDREFYQTRAVTRPTDTGSAGGCKPRPVRGTDKVLTKGVKEFARLPVKL